MFTIRFWGVRGSIASAGVENARVGGNTSCVEVRAGGQLVVLDAGTGLRGFGSELMRSGLGQGDLRAHLLLSHFHWDHIQGFPFFAPAFVAGNRIDVYGPDQGGRLPAFVRGAIDAQMRAPFFPVGLDAMRADLGFHALGHGDTLRLGDASGRAGLTVRTASARHPNGCLAYRIEAEGRSLVFATDTEHDADGGELDRNLVALARDADVLIYDAQYTAAEYAAGKKGWGHSTAEEGVRLALAAGVRRLVLFHHDPGHDDWAVARIEAEARRLFPDTVAAREGERLVLGAEALGRAA